MVVLSVVVAVDLGVVFLSVVVVSVVVVVVVVVTCDGLHASGDTSGPH